MKWQPIETAPMDGTHILACYWDYGKRTDLSTHPTSVKFETFHPNAPGKGAWRNHLGHKMNYLTHWMPMPEAPE